MRVSKVQGEEMKRKAKKLYFVDLPNLSNAGNWELVGVFETRARAVKYCKKNFGADENGNINLITVTDNK